MNQILSISSECFFPFETPTKFKLPSNLDSYTDQKKQQIDSDEESVETNDSIPEHSSPISKAFALEYPEIDVQPKRKNFTTIEEKQKYISEYQKKFKTEVCKNWQIKGVCPYGDKCCFAHGYHELQEKTHLKETYKTKPCKKFFSEGFCPYGHRCQYLHSDIFYLPKFYNYLENLYDEKKIPFVQKNIIRRKKNISYLDKLNNLNLNEICRIGFTSNYNSNQFRLSKLPIFSQLKDVNCDYNF